MLNKEVLAVLKQLTPKQLKYLAKLVDEDTTGNQDDSLYLLLMQAYNECEE